MDPGKKPKTLFGQELEKLWTSAGFHSRAAFLRAADLQNQTVYRWETSWGRPEEDLLGRAAAALHRDVGELQELWRRCRRTAEAEREASVPRAALLSPSETDDGSPAVRVVGAHQEWLGMYLEARGFQPETDRRAALDQRLAKAAGLDGLTPAVVRTIVDLSLEAEGAGPAEIPGDAEADEALKRHTSKGRRPFVPKKRKK